MCLGNDPEPIKPDPLPETLDQEEPEKKTANKTDGNKLSIGTKRYRSPQPSAGYPSVTN